MSQPQLKAKNDGEGGWHGNIHWRCVLPPVDTAHYSVGKDTAVAIYSHMQQEV